MKFNSDDVRLLRSALAACKLGGLEAAVFSENKVRGLGEKKNAAILSDCAFSFGGEISLGVARSAELMKRLDLFGEDVLIEGEVNDSNKVRKLSIRGKGGKIEFRCTDEKLITYPKSNDGDEDGIVVTVTKPEVVLIAKAAKTLGVEALTVQVKRDGGVHIECADTNNDRFETDLSKAAEFVDEPYAVVNPFDATSNGVFISMLEQMVKDNDEATLIFKRSGNVVMRVQGHNMFAIPRIQTGD